MKKREAAAAKLKADREAAAAKAKAPAAAKAKGPAATAVKAGVSRGKWYYYNDVDGMSGGAAV